MMYLIEYTLNVSSRKADITGSFHWNVGIWQTVKNLGGERQCVFSTWFVLSELVMFIIAFRDAFLVLNALLNVFQTNTF